MITPPAFDRRQINAFENHHQLIVAQFERSVVRRRRRKLKRTLLQAFVEQPKAGAIPQQKFHPITPAIEEHVHITAGGILLQGRDDHACKAIKIFA